ncbi:hypothetical protein Tco_0511881 [Tanacetum coccineum]
MRFVSAVCEFYHAVYVYEVYDTEVCDTEVCDIFWRFVTLSRMLLYIKGKEHGKLLVDSVLNGPFQYGTMVEPRNETTPTTIRARTYADLINEENIRESVDIKATNVLLQGSKLSLPERESKLYDDFDTFTSMPGETIHLYYMSKFVTDVKLVKDMHTTNFDHLYAHLWKDEAQANEVRLARQRYPDQIALVANSPTCLNLTQYYPQLSSATQQYYLSLAPQPPVLQQSYQEPVIQQSSSTELDSGLLIPSFNPSDDLIANLNKLMAFVTTTFSPHNGDTVIPGQASQEIPTSTTFQTDDLDAFDSDCDDVPITKAILMANLSFYDLDVFLRVIMEYLVKISKKARILELTQRYLKNTVLTSNTPYPSRRYSIYLMAEEDEFHDDNPPPPPPVTPTQQAPHTLSTIKLPILKKGEYDIWAMKMEHYLKHTDYPIWELERERKARTTLLMAIPEDHLAKFYKMTDAKEMWEAIKSRFGGNDESKKMQKYILKQQFESFSVSNSEGLHKGYDRFQSLLSQLEIHGAGVSTKYANQKFLSTQNVAFVSSESTNNANDVSTAYGGFYFFGLYPKEGSSSYIDELKYSFFANQSSGPQLDHEDLEQVDEFDLEEMDLKWQVAMISMRLKKFYKKTGRRLQDAGNTGYKAKDNGRRPGKQEEPKALVTLDGEGVDWTGHAEDEQENFALMAYSNSGSDTEVTSCSKQCVESYAKLKKLYDTQREQLGDASIEIQAYTQALKKVEAQLVAHQKNQLLYEENIRFMKIDLDDKTDVLMYHKRLLVEVLKIKEELKTKLENFQSSSKGLSKLLNSQMSTRDKFGLGYGNQIHEGVISYEKEVLESVFDSRSSDVEDSPVYDRFAKFEGMHVVPPPMTGNYMPLKSDFGIDESNFTYETLESMPEPVVVEPKVVSQPKVWSDAPIIEEYKETVKEQNTCSPSPKVDKRDWNGSMSKRLGLGYGFTKKACFVCGSFSHLIKDCDFHEKRMAKHVELNKQKGKGTGQGENRPVWNNVQRLNHQNKFVPKALVLLGAIGKLLLRPQQVVIGDPKDITGTKSPNSIVDQALGDPQVALKDIGIFDSRCLIPKARNMATASTNVNGEVELTASIDGQAKTITEASLRRHLKLEDNGGRKKDL